MNSRIKQIVTTSPDTPIDQMAMSWVVEQYIREKKGVNVRIVFNMSPFSLPGQIGKLFRAYEYARDYYVKKYGL